MQVFRRVHVKCSPLKRISSLNKCNQFDYNMRPLTRKAAARSGLHHVALEMSNDGVGKATLTATFRLRLPFQADISLRLKESKALLDAILALQPRDSNSSSGQRPDDVVLAVTQELMARIPGGLTHRKVGHGLSAVHTRVDQTLAAPRILSVSQMRSALL